MTTHQIAILFDALRSGLGASLKSDAGKEFEEAAAAFRELPDQPLKHLITTFRKAQEGSPPPKKKPAFDPGTLIERIRLVRSGAEPPEPVSAELERLSDPQLKAILSAFGLKGTTGKAKNLERVRQLLKNSSNGQPSSVPNAGFQVDAALVELGVQLFQNLKADPDATIPEIRKKLEPMRTYSKPTVEEISRRLGYTPDESREKTFERILSNLEGIKMSQLRAKMILN